MSSKVVLLLLVLCVRSTSSRTAKLEIVSMVFRHGDRSPVGAFPTDPYQKSYWPQGFGQLTQLGMRQHYQLGQYLRRRYMTPGNETYLLNGTYSRDEVFIRSTDTDRTLMSVESLMAAFYKPVERQVFLKNLMWQPVPVHTVSTTDDILLRPYSVNCSRYEQLLKAHEKDDDWIQIMKDNNKLLESVKAHTGVAFNLTPANSFRIWDPIFCQLQHGLSLPQWCSKETLHTLQKIGEFGVSKAFMGREEKKLMSGVFINELVRSLQEKRNGKAKYKKLSVFSAHDLTVAAVLSGLGVYDKTLPPYASVVLIELYSQRRDYFVKIFYHKGPSAEENVALQLLKVPHCSDPCSLDQFIELMSPMMLTAQDFHIQCKNINVKEITTLGHTVAPGVAVVGLAVMVIFIGLLLGCLQMRKNQQLRHTYLDDNEVSTKLNKDFSEQQAYMVSRINCVAFKSVNLFESCLCQFMEAEGIGTPSDNMTGGMTLTRFILVFLPSLCISIKLELVSMVFRHGDRSPVVTFPSDPYQESHWPQGFGQLTQLGMRQQYYLGKYLRHRYMTFGSDTYLLNGTYSRDEVTIRSTDVDRTLMSVESQMAAFYKPVGKQEFLKNLSWQPVPIHTVPVSEDSLLRAYSMDCPRYKQLKAEKRNDDDWLQIMRENKQLLKSVQSYTGVDYSIDPDNVYEIVDPLFCELQHGLKLPAWCTNTTFAVLKNMSTFGVFKMFEGREINRLTSGVFINHIITDMQEKRESKKSHTKKLLVYSAHDTTVAAILSGLGVYDKEIPPYASIVMIELYSDNGKYFVKVFYHKGPSAKLDDLPQLLPIPQCLQECPLDKFVKLMDPITLSEEEFLHECRIVTNDSSTLGKGTIAGIAVLVVVLVIILIGLALWCTRRSFRAKRKYSFVDKRSEQDDSMSDG
ncbi:uncharacterized protein LOC134190336 [Corticium candelabrum]|uniref:uncharacterized protein LOC134190336 n=1 Tax=Corticium candelabrum TaxID=121492 RepID=UPI002E2576B2|nr:uncharacterized protein LOC134190336 [Corticium candelabrum]